MISLLGEAKRQMPSAAWDAARRGWYAMIRARQWPAARFHPWRRASIRQLRRFKDIHRGQRGFIIGNGPSLRETDLSRLEHENTFGLNRIYLLFPELGFSTNYYLSINDLVIEQCRDDILSLRIPRFLSWRSRRFFQDLDWNQKGPPADPPLMYLHTTYTGPGFTRDAGGRLWEGATVTYLALQLAFYMGFDQVILIGVDHNFSTKGKPNTTVVSQGADPDHFSANYFGKGFRWQLPDLETSERAYRMAREAYAREGREILDATLDGKLTVFPKVKYDSLF
jgi:hypothetical protein